MRTPTIKGTAVELRTLRRKKTGTIETTFCGRTFHGKTLGECEERAVAAITRYFERDPGVFHYRGITAIVYACAECWYMSVIHGPDRPFDETSPIQTAPSSSLAADYKTSVEQCLLQMARLAWTEADGLALPSFLVNATTSRQMALAKEWKEWTIFQLRYLAAKNAGLDANESSAYASKDPARSQLWTGRDYHHPALPSGT